MNYLQVNRQSILSKTLWLLLFVALGCSQRSCSCKRIENIKQEIVLAGRLGEIPKDKFPGEFINLLYIKDADTLPPGYMPNVSLIRVDNNFSISSVQSLGQTGWKRFIRNIFPLSPDNYDPDLERRFLTNEIGIDLSVKSPLTDSLKIVSLNKYLLNELQQPQKCKLYFYSADTNNNHYCCKIDISDKITKDSTGLSRKKSAVKKRGKGFGCANPETASRKKKEERKLIDTIFQVSHNIDTINFLIAQSADSVIKNKSGCTVKNQTVKFIIIYEPPMACKPFSSDIKILVSNNCDPLPKCKFILQTSTAKINFKTETIGTVARQPLNTYPNTPDSIGWELTKWSDGLTVNMPGKKIRGIKEIPSFEVIRDQKVKKGTVSFKVTPYEASCKPPQAPVSSNFVFQFSLETACCPPCTKHDTVVINQLRRQIINEFRDLLFMYANTQSPKESAFFKTSAINKIHEIPDVKVEIIPQTDIYVLFNDASSLEEEWLFTPILDKKKCFIIGVKIQRKKT